MGPRITLDQWQALVSVVETGGYAPAADALSKTQSTISYAVQKIEQLLDVKVFRIEGRKAVLTEPGAVLYRRGRALVDEALRLERAAHSLSKGWEAELRLAVEIIFPTWLLLRCFETFSRNHPDTRLELYETVLDGTNELLLEGRVDIAITSRIPPGFLGDALMQARAIAVAAPTHPLHALGRELVLADLQPHRHIFVRDSGTQRSRTAAWEGTSQRWTVSNKATSIRALCMGLGFAWLTEEIIRDELESGALKPLPLTEGSERWATLHLVHADGYSVGPGAREMDTLIREAVAACPDSVLT
jgi:DNA-binding transcriptional LysR family regulator